MKRTVLTTVFAFFAFFLTAQQGFNLDDTETLLEEFFDADTLNEYGEALWEPLTLADELNARLSDDGWVHTRLDTILYYAAYDIPKAVAVFETVSYEQGRMEDGAQISFAIFDKNLEGSWRIERFAKHQITLASSFYGGFVGLAQFGENQWCLSLEMTWNGQGVYAEYMSFLNLEDLQKVFNLTIHEDNMGVLGENTERAYSFDKAIHLLPTVETVTGWWEFDLVTQGTQPDNDVERAVPANSVERYAFDWETGTYMKVCR
jgi:hypothetical protein